MTEPPVCARCNRWIMPGQAYRTVNTPEGPVTVHENCLQGDKDRSETKVRP